MNEPIKITGIITDEVTEPPLDGTAGSALYAVPFRLSQTPSQFWSEAFVSAWNSPPRRSMMHRPGIASVYGDKIVLDGTDIDEVKKYHRDTLILCVKVANDQEKEWLAQTRREEETRRNQIEEHRKDVEDGAQDISFDEEDEGSENRP